MRKKSPVNRTNFDVIRNCFRIYSYCYFWYEFDRNCPDFRRSEPKGRTTFALTLQSGAMKQMTVPMEKMSNIVKMSIITVLSAMTAL